MRALSKRQEDALLHVGFGVSARENGHGGISYFDEDDRVVNTRSLDALADRGLIWGGLMGASPMVSYIRLTPQGETVFEKVLHERRAANPRNLFEEAARR